MNIDPTKIRDRIRRKALHTPCRFRVVAVGLDARGRYIGIAVNRPRFYGPGGGRHAEEVLIHRSPPSLAKILLARVGLSGEFRPIEPCPRCAKMAARRGIVIEEVRLS